MATFVMSYPGPTWRPAFAPNQQPPVLAAAMQEWLSLCDHITRAGGRIFVVDPPGEALGRDADLVYMGRLGALFPQAAEGPVFLLAEPAAAIGKVLLQAGLQVKPAVGDWSGQVDVISISRNRFVLTYRGEEGKQALGQVRALLPPSARVLEFALRPGFRHGDECLGAFTSSAQHSVILLYVDGLADCSLETVQRFAGDKIDVIPMGEEDGRAKAGSSLCVRGTLILPTGLSSFLRGTLVRHGFHLVEQDLPELLGRGGGGPRSIVNELVGFVVSDDAPSYALRREELQQLVLRYGLVT